MNRQRLVVVVCGLVCSAPHLMASSAARAQDVITMQSDLADANEARILESLETRVSFDFRDRALAEVIEYLSGSTGLTIKLDLKGLEDAAISSDSPVTFAVPSVTLRSALRLMLGQMDLTWVIKNEVLVITTPEKAGNELLTRVYLVHDLVVRREGDKTFHNYQQLIDLITATLAPTTWDEVGGPGAIHEYRASSAIVISQTREVHEQIVPLLAALRRARDLQHLPYDSLPYDAPAASRSAWRRAVPSPTIESSEPPRYVIQPDAGWLVPRVHD